MSPLIVGVSEKWRELVIAEARDWIGTPFHLNSDLKSVGVDCGRFPRRCYAVAGIEVPDLPPHWPRDFACNAMADKEPYLEIIRQSFREVSTPDPGDLALFRPLRSRCYSHAAIVVAWPKVIHARGVGTSPKVELGRADQWPLAGSPTLFFTPSL